jgi:hypothetical protein
MNPAVIHRFYCIYMHIKTFGFTVWCPSSLTYTVLSIVTYLYSPFHWLTYTILSIDLPIKSFPLTYLYSPFHWLTYTILSIDLPIQSFPLWLTYTVLSILSQWVSSVTTTLKAARRILTLVLTLVKVKTCTFIVVCRGLLHNKNVTNVIS